MSFVGKILVVFVFVLSIMFMAAAGSVYTVHMDWRTDSGNKQKKIDDLTRQKNDAETALQKSQSDAKSAINVAEQRAALSDAELKRQTADLAQFRKDRGDLEIRSKTASEQVEIATEESDARKSEADTLRQLIHEMQQLRDKEFAIRTDLEDKLHSLQLDFEAARLKNKDLLGQVALLKQALESAGVSSDVSELATRSSPAPRVEGKITDVKPSKKQGSSELVEVSLGSDDGLKKGHEMTVYRSGLGGGQKPKYLCKIVIVNTTPDRSVGQVVESSRNGVIQKGDNVTTKL